MIRIDVLKETPHQITLQISGRLSEHETPLFETEIRQWLGHPKSIVLDLTNITFLGGYALDLLKEWTPVKLIVQDTPRSSVELLLEAAKLPYRRVPYVQPRIS